MAADIAARDALLAALQGGTANLAAFVAWAQSMVDLNQLNSEVISEFLFFINA